MTLLTELAGHYRHGRIEDTKGVTGEGLARLQLNVARRGTRCVGMKTTKTRYDTCTRIRAKSKMSPHQSLPIAVARHHSDHHSEQLVIKFYCQLPKKTAGGPARLPVGLGTLSSTR